MPWWSRGGVELHGPLTLCPSKVSGQWPHPRVQGASMQFASRFYFPLFLLRMKTGQTLAVGC